MDRNEHVDKYLGELHDNGVIDPVGVNSEGQVVYSIPDLNKLAEFSPEVYETYKEVYIHATYCLFIEGDLEWVVEDYENKKGHFELTEYGKKKYRDVQHAMGDWAEKVVSGSFE